MNTILVFGFVFLGYFLVTLLYTFAVRFGKDTIEPVFNKHLSILVAARNEEKNILECLESLEQLDYPKELLEILIGDDQSTDQTAVIIQDFIKDKPHFRYVKITEQWKGIKMKHNVLAQLARLSTGEILLVTDADIQIPPTWASHLIAGIDNKVGMTSGPTVVEGESLLAKMQFLDWMMGVSIAKAHATLGIPLTGVGNNMAISKEAYDSTGGYENIEFSITEDYKLFQSMCEKGNWDFVQYFSPEVYNKSKATENIKDLLKQRKRWFKGGMEIPWYNKAFVAFNAIVIPALLASFFVLGWRFGVLFLGVKVLSDGMFLLNSCVRLKKVHGLVWFPLFELYYILEAVILPINQMIPTDIEWKNRKF